MQSKRSHTIYLSKMLENANHSIETELISGCQERREEEGMSGVNGNIHCLVVRVSVYTCQNLLKCTL